MWDGIEWIDRYKQGFYGKDDVSTDVRRKYKENQQCRQTTKYTKKPN